MTSTRTEFGTSSPEQSVDYAAYSTSITENTHFFNMGTIGVAMIAILLIAVHFSFTAALSANPSANNPLRQPPPSSARHHHQQPSNICIVQNGGGGHGTLAYYLGQEILRVKDEGEEEEDSVSSLARLSRLTILQDNCDYQQQPFSSYRSAFQDNINSRVRVLPWSDVKTASREKLVSLGLGRIDYLVDNWSKKIEDVDKVLRLAREVDVSQLVFISSAGMYQEGNYHGHSMPPLREDDPVQEDNAARKVEREIISSGLSYTILRLQYLYGELSNKRYLDYFWRFLEKGEDISWPGSGDQLVALTHQRDVARCMLQVLGHPGAVKEIFNCGTDRYVSYATLARLATEAWKHCGKSSKMGKADGGGKADDFPFRSTTFITSPNKAMARVGWKAREDLWDGLLKEASSYRSVLVESSQ